MAVTHNSGTNPLIFDDLAAIEAACAAWSPGTRRNVDSALCDASLSLARRKHALLSMFVRETGYAYGDCVVLWSAIDRFFAGIQQAMSHAEHLALYESKHYGSVRRGSRISFIPRGRVLCVIPGNAAIPLAAIIPAAMVAAGNLAIVGISSRARDSGIGLATEVGRHCADGLVLWSGSIRALVGSCIRHRAVDCLYFVGSSSHYPEMARECAAAGVDLLFEGEGNGVALIDHPIPEPDLLAAVRLILKSKQFCNGQMCSAPNVVLVHEDVLEHARSLYRSHSEQFQLGRSIGQIVGEDRLVTLLKGTALAEERTSVARERTPIWADGMPFESAVSTETACPLVYACTYKDSTGVAALMRKTKYRLQLSVFGSPQRLSKTIIQSAPQARVTFNMCPTSQDPLLPWGNYGGSGVSPVVDFVMKGLVRTIHENWS